MTTITIQQAFRPFFFTCFIVGLSIYPSLNRKSRTKWVVYLSILYSATLWFIYGYLFYYMLNYILLVGLFFPTIQFIVLGINFTTTITSAIFIIYYHKRLQMCIKKLSVVDDNLKELGSLHIYQKVHMLSKGLLAGWILCNFALTFIDFLSWQNLLSEENGFWIFILSYIYRYTFHINALEDLIFLIVLWYVGTRFDEVHKHIQNLLTKKEHWLRNTWMKPAIIVHQYTLDTNNNNRVLWSLMHLHLELCRIAREWNLMFGMQIIFEMMSYPLIVTSICYFLYKALRYEHQEDMPMHVWFRAAFWLFISLGKVYIINYICENICAKANKIDKTINKLTNILQCADIWKEIYQFTLHTMQNPLKFTGMGFFDLGNKFVIKFCTTVTTYVIIMLQMSNGTLILKKNN